MKNSIFDLVEGLKPVDRKDLEEYERAMRDEAIPEMLEESRRRAQLARDARQREIILLNRTRLLLAKGIQL